MLIVAISDTHMPSRARFLPEPLLERLRTADLIFHAGDLTTMGVLEQLRALGPTFAVSGNVDDPDLMSILPRTRIIQAGSYRIGLVHGDGPGPSTVNRARRAFEGVDCIVFGHSHSPYLQRHDGVLMLNPGSPTDKRREPRPSFALIMAEDQLSAEIVYL